MKNSIYTNGNQIRDLPAYSAETQPTAPPAACTHLGFRGFMLTPLEDQIIVGTCNK
jgi:hypothetical protein